MAELPKPATWKSYLLSLAVVAVALSARFALDPYLGNLHPYVTFYVAVTVVAWYEGLGPTLVAIVAGACVSDYFFVAPRHTFAIGAIASQVGFGAYFMVTLPIALLAQRQKRDAAARIKAEERLSRQEAVRESEEQFRTLANAIPQLAWMANPDGWIFWYNQRWYEYTGTTPQQMEGWRWQSVHDPEMLPQVIEQWKASIATGEPFEMVFPLRGTDGLFRPFLTRVMPVKDAEGKVVRWFGTNTDISGQKQIEAELRKGKERLDLALEVASVGEWEIDLTLHTGFRSQRHAEIFGDSFSAADWSFESFIDHVLPEHRAEVVEKVKASLITGVWDFETQIRRVDGEIRWIWARGCSLLDETGKPVRMYGTVMDITERKRAESIVQATLRRLYVILSNMHAGVLLVADEGKIEFANQAFCNCFGLTDAPEDLLGCEPGTMIEKIKNAYGHPDEADTRIRQILDRGEPVTGEELAMQGGRTYLRDFVPLNVDGISFGRLWIHTDISERKRGEEARGRLAAIVESSSDAIISKTLDGIVSSWNQSAERLFGYSAEEIIGQPITLIIPPDRHDEEQTILERMLRGERVDHYETKRMHKNGQYIDVSLTISPIRDALGAVIGVSKSVRDITERRRAEAELENAKLQAEGSAAQLRTVIESLTERVYVCKPNGDLIVANQASRATYGADASAAAPNVSEMDAQIEAFALDGRKLSPSEWPIARVLQGERVRSLEVRIHFKATNQDVIISSNGEPVRDRQGNMLMAVLTSADITERKRAEQELQENGRLLSLALEAGQSGFFDWDLVNATSKWSPELERLYGIEPGVFGGTLEQWREWVLPEDLPVAEECGREAYRTGKLNGEWRIKRQSDGEIRWLSAYGTVLHDNSGKPVRLVGINVDITERKQVLETLRESEARFRSVLDSSRDFIYRTDVRTGRYEYISPSVRAVMGFSPDELMSMGHQGSLAMIHPDDLPVVHAWLARLEDTGEGELEYRLRGGDGKFRWLSNHASITKDSAGRPLYRNGSVRDITERKRVEATLRESEEINRITFEQAAVGISHVAPDGTWLHVNQKLCDIVGYTREELLKMRFQEITHPDDLAADDAPVAKLLAGEIETYSLEKRYIRKDHTIIWINLTVSMVRTASGEPRHSISITEDITQRKRAETALEKGRAELDAALASMTDAVFISDATGQFINFNDAFATFHKFRNKSECAKKLSDYPDFLDVFTADGQLAPLEMWAVPRALRGETVTNAEYRLRRKDTGETWVGSYSFSPIRDNHGTIVGSVVVGRDITESKRAEEALRESELRYRLLFENNMDAIFLTKAGGKVIAANPAACAMFDTTEEAFCQLGRQWTADTDDPRLASALEERARTGKFKGELTYIRPNGTKFIGEVNSVLLPDGDLHFAILRDITDRKRGEQALRESEERLRSMGDNLPESYVYQFTHNADGSPRFLYLSAGVEKLHGVSADDVLRDANVLHRQIEQEQLAAMVAAEAASLQTLTDFQMELRMCRSDGQWRWFHLRSRPRRKPDGQFLWDGVATDITERKRVQEKLRESEVLYHSLFNSMVEAFCIVEVIFDPEGKATDFRFLEVNPAFEKQTGLHEPVGKRMSELVPSNEAYWCEIYGKIALTGEPAHFDNEAKALNRYYEVRAYRVGEPELRQVAIVFNDISGRKRTEQALRESEVLYHNLFNSMDEGFCIAEMIFDSEGKPADYRFLEVNAAFEKQTGMHDVVGKRVSELVPSLEAYWRETYGNIALTGEPAHFENEAKALNCYYEVRAYRVGVPELRQVAVVFNDISGRKRAEEVLRSALEEKTALLKEVHHRVKNNLQIVSSLLNLQARQVKNDVALETLRDTQGRIHSMALLHETLYREGNAGRVNCSIYFSHLCAHLCRAFGQMGERVRVRTEIAPLELGIDVAIPCGLIINELVSNSFKHAFPDGRRGEIMVKIHNEAEGRIVLSVGDDGIGLTPGADYQQSSTLGTKLVTGLAKQIAGTLEVKSEHGTTVQVSFINPEKVGALA